MIKKIWMGIACLVLAANVNAQDAVALKHGNSITESSLRKHLEILAADDMEGRDTGKEGQRKAAAYIAGQFADLGLKPVAPNGNEMGYLQNFDLESTGWGKVEFKAGRNTFVNGDVIFFGSVKESKSGKSEIVFVGNGEASSLEGLNLTDKTALLYAPGPGYEAKVDAIKEKGANAVMVVNAETAEQYQNVTRRFRNFATARRLGLPNPNLTDNLLWLVSPEHAASIIGKTQEEMVAMAADGSHKSLKPIKYSYEIERVVEKVPTANVIGMVEGTDLKDEYVVLSAHYDHVGVTADGQVNNGADDDGSGTSAVIDIARVFKTAANEGNGPRRSMVFLLVTGEEKGLLGSRYYTDFDPIFPHEKTITNINIDMIGRLDTEHEESGVRNYVYPIGSEVLSSELKVILDYNNVMYTNMDLDYRYDDPEDTNRFYFRSDHYNFAKNNIPVIFFFNGVHADYHRPSDTIDKIEWDVFETRARLVFYTSWDLANRNRKPMLDTQMDQRLLNR
ncbi:M28 family peptidase [Peijinzhouia sedimentorum]